MSFARIARVLAGAGLCGCLLLGSACGPRAGSRRVIVPAREDREFVLERQPRGGDPVLVSAALGPIHPQEEWWPYRAGFLGISERQAKERDAAVTDRQPPPGFWDEQTALESLHLWAALCNECHGGRRRPEDLAAMPAPPAGWGRGEGVFFGKFRPYAELFGIVFNGGPDRDGKPSEMPAWKGKIAKEQIWAVLYFLEYQSGGIEGPVPPSLRPRKGAALLD